METGTIKTKVSWCHTLLISASSYFYGLPAPALLNEFCHDFAQSGRWREIIRGANSPNWTKKQDSTFPLLSQFFPKNSQSKSSATKRYNVRSFIQGPKIIADSINSNSILRRQTCDLFLKAEIQQKKEPWCSWTTHIWSPNSRSHLGYRAKLIRHDSRAFLALFGRELGHLQSLRSSR